MANSFDLILPEVVAEIPSWFKQPEIEGNIPHAYCDSVGVVTAGAGTAFFSVGDMQFTQWDTPDGSRADSTTVAACYIACKALYDSHPHGTLAAGAYSHLSPIRLSQATIDAEILRWFKIRMPIITSFLPDFQHYSSGVQLGICDMGYNMGASCFKGYPKFMSAIRSLDWKGAAAECATPGQNHKRNEMRADLFVRDL